MKEPHYLTHDNVNPGHEQIILSKKCLNNMFLVHLAIKSP